MRLCNVMAKKENREGERAFLFLMLYIQQNSAESRQLAKQRIDNPNKYHIECELQDKSRLDYLHQQCTLPSLSQSRYEKSQLHHHPAPAFISTKQVLLSPPTANDLLPHHRQQPLTPTQPPTSLRFLPILRSISRQTPTPASISRPFTDPPAPFVYALIDTRPTPSTHPKAVNHQYKGGISGNKLNRQR